MPVTNKTQLIDSAVEWYIKERPIYEKLCQKVESIITEILELNEISFHIVTSRGKEINSFKDKISKEKYNDPTNQITDLAGVRIIAYVEDDLKQICNTIEQVFEIDKEKSLDKSKELGIDKVGYKSVHYVAKLKVDRIVLPEYKTFENRYFEIQIRTILQHAWAEIEHDRNYKFSGKLPDEISRRFKLLAGTLEIADREFNNIAKEIDNISKQVEEGTKSGHLDFELNSTSLKQYLETKFDDVIKTNVEINFNVDKKLLMELKNYGINSLSELDQLVPKDFSKKLSSIKYTGIELSSYGIIRMIMIINDYDRYFSKVWKNSWPFWDEHEVWYDFFKKFGVDWSEIESKYDVGLTIMRMPNRSKATE